MNIVLAKRNSRGECPYHLPKTTGLTSGSPRGSTLGSFCDWMATPCRTAHFNSLTAIASRNTLKPRFINPLIFLRYLPGQRRAHRTSPLPRTTRQQSCYPWSRPFLRRGSGPLASERGNQPCQCAVSDSAHVTSNGPRVSRRSCCEHCFSTSGLLDALALRRSCVRAKEPRRMLLLAPEAAGEAVASSQHAHRPLYSVRLCMLK